jgi:hypothetical protein
MSSSFYIVFKLFHNFAYNIIMKRKGRDAGGEIVGYKGGKKGKRVFS